MAVQNNASIGFEKQIWDAACVLWGHIPAAEYRKVIVGLIFLRYISSAFEKRYQQLVEEDDGFEDDKDAYAEDNIFFVPEDARWSKIASAAHTPEIGTVIDDAMRAIEKENTSDADFLYYLTCSPLVRNPAIKSMVGLSGRQRVQTDVVANLDIELPPLEEQRKVGGLLKAFDDKIKLNKEINNNLEQQAQTLFKSWFVDFEPFDESFIDSPIGTKIPHSLQMVQIGSLPHILETGKRPKGGAVATGVPSIGAENVKRLGEVNFASAKYIPVEFAQKMDKGKVHGYELMLYKDGGKPGTFIPHFSMFGEGFPYDDFFINEHVFKLDFGDKGFNEFCYFYLQTDYPYNWLANNGGKAAVPGINQQDVNSIWIYPPDNPLVKEYCKWVQPIFTTILRNCSQNVKLSQLRDALLPKLMSGELDVSDIEI